MALFPWQPAVMAEWRPYSKIKWGKGRVRTQNSSLQRLKNLTRHGTEGGETPQKNHTLQASLLQLYSHSEFCGSPGTTASFPMYKWSFSRARHGGSRWHGEEATPARPGVTPVQGCELIRAGGAAVWGSGTTLKLVRNSWQESDSHQRPTALQQEWQKDGFDFYLHRWFITRAQNSWQLSQQLSILINSKHVPTGFSKMVSKDIFLTVSTCIVPDVFMFFFFSLKS